uniref:Fibronectin type III domain-containing protein n=2 Tax=Wuchereria bancrofti TaxID=6293 RepID=A0AAF5PG80_WUCBA
MSFSSPLSITVSFNVFIDIIIIITTLITFTLLAGVITGAKCSNLLRLEPPPLNNSRYVVRVDRKFRISCICQQTSLNCLHLAWRNEFGRKIDGESSNSLFTVELREHDSMYKKLSLVFTQIAKRDTGIYKCVARNSRRISANWKVEIIVVDEIHWNENNDIVGGMFGESLTIDCGSTGNPQPETYITNHNGFPLNETLFVTAGSEVTVKRLTNEYQDVIIKCLSVQEFEKYDATVVEQHEIRLDVWSSPEFNKPFVERFIVLDYSAQICCNVTRSNPPARHFRYLKGSDELRNDTNHIILIDVLNQRSCLKILSPTEYDLGEYQCEVSNGKSKSQQTIAVKEATPPGEVHVSLQDVGMTYVLWKIEEGFGEQLPIRRYIIEYIKKSILEQSRDQTRENNRVWFAHAVKMNVPLNKNGLYEIGGLRQGTTYIFRFKAENEAGIGDAVTVAVKTTSRIKLSKLTRSASLSLQQLTLIPFVLHFFPTWPI